MTTNEYGQPVGEEVPGWTSAPRPDAETLPGRYCTLEHLDADRHADSLYDAYAVAQDDRDWTYLPYGPFRDRAAYRAWAHDAAQSADPLHYAVVDRTTGRVSGTLALMRHDPGNGVIEVGNVVFSRGMQRTPMSTEAQFLLMRYVFDDLGYRRYEWKCDSLNTPSCRAAERLGFAYEGTFRQAVVYKGRNRDTAWYAIVDGDWPRIRAAYEAWLAPTNFTGDGRQIDPLRTTS